MAEASTDDNKSSTSLSKSGSLKRMKQRGSSIFQRARMSFVRSSGIRGADLATLRGNGADFEGKARVTRGVEGLTLCCCCFEGGEVDKERILLIKGPFCFVFVSETAPSPKYAIGLQGMRAEIKSGHHHGRFLVALETNLGDVDYEFSFETEKDAKDFKNAVAVESETAEVEMIRKRLGHENLIVKRSSVRFAEEIAKKKVKDQPDAPISTEEIMENLPVTPTAPV